MDLSKVYYCLPRDLLVAKFEDYGNNKNILNLIHNYFSNRKHRKKKKSSYSDWYDIVMGVPQSIVNLWSIIIQLFINDLTLFIERTNISSFADGNATYSCHNDLKTVQENLKYDMVTS